MKENKRKIHHPDDNLFKKVMEDKINAKAYLEEFHPELAKNMDLDRLQIQSEIYKFPFWTIEEITDFTEISKTSVQALVLALLSGKLEPLHFMTKKFFFKEIELSKKEWKKIDKMVTNIFNSDFMLRRKS